MFLRLLAILFFAMGVLQQQWQLALGLFLFSWGIFIVQSQDKWRLDISDTDLRQLLAGVQISLPTMVLGAYFGYHYTWWIGGGLFGCLGVTLLLIRVLRYVEKSSSRLRFYIAWSWILLWQGGLTALLAWMAFS